MRLNSLVSNDDFKKFFVDRLNSSDFPSMAKEAAEQAKFVTDEYPDIIKMIRKNASMANAAFGLEMNDAQMRVLVGTASYVIAVIDSVLKEKYPD